MRIFKCVDADSQRSYLRTVADDDGFVPLTEGQRFFCREDFIVEPELLDYAIHLSDTRAEATVSQYLYECAILVTFLGEKGTDWKTITEFDLRSYRLYRTTPGRGTDRIVGERSWQRCRSVVEGFLTFMKLRRHIEQTPYIKIAGQSVLGGRSYAYETNVRALTSAQWNALVESGFRGKGLSSSRPRSSERDTAASRLMVLTGMRIGEVAHLLAAEVTLSKNEGDQLRLRAIAKGGRDRIIQIPGSVRKSIGLYMQTERIGIVLRSQARLRSTPDLFWVEQIDCERVSGTYRGQAVVHPTASLPRELRRRAVKQRETTIEPLGLFLSESTGLPLSPAGWHRAFRVANARVRTSNQDWRCVTPHDLRHTYAVRLLKATMTISALDARHNVDSPTLLQRMSVDPLSRVQRALGHANPNTTTQYLYSEISQDDTVSLAIEAYLDSGLDAAEYFNERFGR